MIVAWSLMMMCKGGISGIGLSRTVGMSDPSSQLSRTMSIDPQPSFPQGLTCISGSLAGAKVEVRLHPPSCSHLCMGGGVVPSTCLF
jgi:hypothetical protein